MNEMKEGILTNPRPSNTASTIPAVKEEQLSWLMSRGTEIWRSIGGSLSMIMSGLPEYKSMRIQMRLIHTFICVFDTLLDSICRLSEHGLPDLSMN